VVRSGSLRNPLAQLTGCTFWRIAMKRSLVICAGSLLFIAVRAGDAHAYDQYSANRDATNCRTCHGDFRAATYTSPKDNQAWGNLHDLHRTQMLSGDCSTCHGTSFFPVMLASSSGGSGLAALGCVGCHGRAADNTTANPNGYGAGLRQHHQRSGVTICTGCHADADPTAFTPAGEDVLPPYYADPGTGHANMPTNSCNTDGSEDMAGATTGLDNDGDGVDDGADTDCAAAGGAGGAGGASGGTGGTVTGGTGGTVTGGTGGTVAGGTAGTGGAITGGAAGTAGTATAGQGGSSAGAGGVATGGTGAAAGGVATGGFATGGTATGGTTTGGTANGGAETGGTGTGSADDGGCGCRVGTRGPASNASLSAMLLGLGLFVARRRRSARGR
jgi:MYXO-CTERM domain-containing protein